MPRELDLLVRARYPLIWLNTPEEHRAISLICATARALGDEVQAWSQTWGLHDVPGEPKAGGATDPLKVLDTMRKHPRKTIWILKDFPALLSGGSANPPLERALRDTAQVMKAQGSVVVCLSNGIAPPVSLEGDASVHNLALPDEAEHRLGLDRVATDLNLRVGDENARVLAQACLGLTLEQAENIWARVVAGGGKFTAADVSAVVAEKERIVRGSGYLEFVQAQSLDQVGGLHGLKQWVLQRELGFSERAREVGLPFPRGVLLVGVQGCGKSLTAKAVAGAWRQPLLRMDVGALMEGYVGASERNLRTALTLAERIAPCVLWVDEIEKAFSGLDTSSDGGTITRMFGTILTWMQEKQSPVFVLATANKIDKLPPEFLRKGRFDEIFFVDLPGPDERREIWRIHLGDRARRGRDPDLLTRLDLESLIAVSDGYTGAEIAAAVVEAAFAALAVDQPLDGMMLTTALGSSPPLSRLRAEDVEALRGWARGRARKAG